MYLEDPAEGGLEREEGGREGEREKEKEGGGREGGRERERENYCYCSTV